MNTSNQFKEIQANSKSVFKECLKSSQRVRLNVETKELMDSVYLSVRADCVCSCLLSAVKAHRSSRHSAMLTDESTG